MSQKQLLNVAQLADALNVNRSWVYQQTSQSKIPFIKVGKYVRFDLGDVLNFLQKNSDASLSQQNHRPTMSQMLTENGNG